MSSVCADLLFRHLGFFCHILCSNCGHEGVQWILETYHVQYNNNAHVYE